MEKFGFFMDVLHCSWCSCQEQKGLVYWFKVLNYFIKYMWYVFKWFIMYLKYYIICIHDDWNNYDWIISKLILHTLAWLFLTKLTNQHTLPPYLPLKPATPSKGVLLGLLCNYIKFWYFCVFALWPKSLRFYVKVQKR